jgi:SdrD B-like domain
MNKSLRPRILKAICFSLLFFLFNRTNLHAQITVSLKDTISTCLGANFKIVITTDAGNGATFSWIGPNGFTSNEKDADIRDLNDKGLGLYAVLITAQSGQTATATTFVKTNAIETAVIGGFTNVCVGENLRLRDIIIRPAGEQPLTYFWTGPDNYTSTAFQTNIPTTEDLRQAGEYSLTETYENGCIVTAKLTPTINKCLSIGNLVWEDSNNDGIFNNTEKGIGKVTVRLYKAVLSGGFPINIPDGVAIRTTTTDSLTGKYLFKDLVPGAYLVEIDAPANYLSSSGAGINGLPTGTYEPSPDANNDSNDIDDGSLVSGQIIRTTFIELANYSEPQNDGDATNGTAADKNSNLTIDFGLYKVPECKREICVPYAMKKSN